MPPTVLRAKSPGDLLVAIPYLLGFHPADSLVVLGMSGPRQRVQMQLRLDLPDARKPEFVRLLLGLFARERLPAAVLVVYAATDWAAPGPLPEQALAGRLTDALSGQGVDVVDVLACHAGRWRSYRCEHPLCCPPGGTALPPVTDSPLAATAVYAGLVARPDRSALVASLDPVGDDDRAAVAAELARLAAAETAGGPGRPRGSRQRRRQVHALADLARRAEDGEWLPAPEAAQALRRLADTAVRDACWQWGPERIGDRGLALFTQLARRAELAADATAMVLAGWAAWWQGDSTLAGIALDRALDAQPDHRLARLLDEVLTAMLKPPAAGETADEAVGMGAHGWDADGPRRAAVNRSAPGPRTPDWPPGRAARTSPRRPRPGRRNPGR